MAANLVYKEDTEPTQPSTIINLDSIEKILTNIKLIQFSINRADEEREAFLKTNDMQAESNKKNMISELTTEISAKISQTSRFINDMKASSAKKAESLDTPMMANAELRIENTIVNVFQAKLYELIKASSKLQLDIKDSYQEKMKRQLAVHVPNATESQMEELMSKPEVKSQGNQQLHTKTDVRPDKRSDR